MLAAVTVTVSLLNYFEKLTDKESTQIVFAVAGVIKKF